jgi:NADH:ubiquinone oxidoreductase subunit 3 (subunit A)
MINNLRNLKIGGIIIIVSLLLIGYVMFLNEAVKESREKQRRKSREFEILEFQKRTQFLKDSFQMEYYKIQLETLKNK